MQIKSGTCSKIFDLIMIFPFSTQKKKKKVLCGLWNSFAYSKVKPIPYNFAYQCCTSANVGQHKSSFCTNDNSLVSSIFEWRRWVLMSARWLIKGVGEWKDLHFYISICHWSLIKIPNTHQCWIKWHKETFTMTSTIATWWFLEKSNLTGEEGEYYQ